MSESSLKESEVLQKNLDQCETWLARAGMAKQHGNVDLTKQALGRAWQYQCSVAHILKVRLPRHPRDAEELEKWLSWHNQSIKRRTIDLPPDPDSPTDRLQGAKVPRKPLPTSGAGEIALQLPNKSETED